MNTTLVINRKGGAGKTTVATNLASYFASHHVATTIMDYDPQGSSLNWLKSRPSHLGKIHGANAAPERFGTMRGVDATGWDFLTGTDQHATLRDDIELIASCPLLPRDLQVGGFVFDVHTGQLVRVLD